MRKGQLEMVGLAVIVVILVVVLLLFVTLNRGEDTSAITARESLYANNLLNAIMFYSLEKGSVSDYIVKCDEYNTLYEINPSDDVRIMKEEYCGVSGEIFNFMKYPLLKQNQKYSLLFKQNCGGLREIGSGCGEEFISSSPYHIRTKSGVCTIQLNLC